MNSNIYNFYSQTGFAFNGFLNISNNFFSGIISFLGTNNNASMRINDGKIKNDENIFISSFNKIGDVEFSGNLSSSNFNLFINNKLIYVENKNYGYLTGIKFESLTDNNNFRIFIYGDKPEYILGNQDSVYSLEPISCYISGNSNNIKDFNIYTIDIGGTLDANVGNSSYVPRNFFEISGQNIWTTGLKMGPGDVYHFNINQKSLFDTRGGYTYIPLYIDTEFGTIYKRFFVKVISPQTIEKIFLDINQDNVDTAEPPYVKFLTKTYIQSSKEDHKNFLIYLSGLDGNNENRNGYIDTFTGSWGISMNNIDFDPIIVKSGNVEIYDNTNNLTNTISKSGIYYNFLTGTSGNITGISGILENQIAINSGYYNGIAFSVPYIYNTTFNITGINFGIYNFGHYTGIRTPQINSGISGGIITVSLFEIDKNYVLKSMLGSETLYVKNIFNTGNNTGNIYKINNSFPVYTNKSYALIINGYSSGHQYGYKLFLPTGDLNFETSNINYMFGVSGNSQEIGQYPTMTGNRIVPFLQILGEKITDNNILIGSGNLDVAGDVRSFIDIYKIYNFNNSNYFTGSAFLYISGESGFVKSGKLSIYHNLYREIESDVEYF